MTDSPPPRRSRRDRLRRGWIMALGGLVARLLIRGLHATLRLRPLLGERHLEGVVAGGRPAIFAFWHNRQLVCAYVAGRRLLRAGRPVTVMTSLSRDGEVAARAARGMGVGVVRGSTSRGGLAALRGLHRVIARQGASVLTAPDGPRGPVYRCQEGVVTLAQMANAPIVPLAFAAERFWRLKSWDRLIVPRPFSRVVMAVGEPVSVPRGLDREETAERALRLQETLDALVADCERALRPTG